MTFSVQAPAYLSSYTSYQASHFLLPLIHPLFSTSNRTKLHDLQFFKNARLFHTALPLQTLLLLAGIFFPFCLPSKQTPTPLSKFSSSITFSVKFPDPSLMDVHPGRILTLPSGCPYPTALPSGTLSHVWACSCAVTPFYCPSHHSLPIRKFTTILSGSQVLTPHHSALVEKREGGKAAKLESPINSTQKYIPHLTVPEQLSC